MPFFFFLIFVFASVGKSFDKVELSGQKFFRFARSWARLLASTVGLASGAWVWAPRLGPEPPAPPSVTKKLENQCVLFFLMILGRFGRGSAKVRDPLPNLGPRPRKIAKELCFHTIWGFDRVVGGQLRAPRPFLDVTIPIIS